MWLRNKIRCWLGTQALFYEIATVRRAVQQDASNTEQLRTAIVALGRTLIRIAEDQEAQMRNMEEYNQAVKDLADKVAALSTVEQSAVALINGMRERINSLITESDGIVPVAELQKLSSALDVGTKALADAVAANTTPDAPPAAPAEATTTVDPDAPPLPPPNPA